MENVSRIEDRYNEPLCNEVIGIKNPNLGVRRKWPSVERWPLWGGRGEIYKTISLGGYIMFIVAKFMLTIFHNGNPFINDIYRDKIHKKT